MAREYSISFRISLGRSEKCKDNFTKFYPNQAVLGENEEKSASSISKEGTSNFWPILMLNLGNTCFRLLNFELKSSISYICLGVVLMHVVYE